MGNIAGYITNLGKSVSYSALDRVKKMTPSVTEFAETNGELFKTVYSDIINFRQTYKRSLNTVKKGKVYEAADEGINALFQDIKSGNFYNKKRQDTFDKRGMGIDAFNDSLGGFDESSNGDFGNNGSDGWGDWTDDSNIDIDNGEDNASAISMSVAKAAEYTANVHKTSTNLLYTQGLKTFGMINSGLDNVNRNIANLTPLVSLTQTAAENQKKFYENTTTVLNDVVGLMRTMSETLQSMRPKQQKQRHNDNINFSDIIGAGGMPNLKTYGKAIKQNVMNNGGGLVESMMGMFKDDENPNANPLLSFVASPLKFIPDMIVNKLIPKEIDKAADKFDKSLSGFFGSLMAKFNTMASDDNDNIVTKYIGKLLGVNPRVKKRIDTSKYNKDTVDWNGKNSKSLNEVIPTYLRKILAAVSGQDEMIFDYNKGAFLNAGSIKKSFKSLHDSYADNATSDVKTAMIEKSKAFSFSDKKEKESLEKSITSVLKQVFENGTIFDVNSKDEFMHSKYGVSKKDMAMIKALFRSLDNNQALQMNRDVLEGRERLNSQMEEMHKSESVYSTMFDGSKSGEFLKRNKDGKIDKKNSSYYTFGMYAKDHLGHNIFYYLQNMYKELQFFNINGSSSRNGLPTSSDINTGGRVKRITGADGKFHYITHAGASDINIKDEYNEAGETRRKYQHQRDDQERFIKNEGRRISKAHKGTVVNMSDVDDDKAEARATNALNVQKVDEMLKEKAATPKGWVQQGIDDLLQANSLNDKMKIAIAKIQNLSAKPMAFITNTLDKADQRLYEMIYGKKGAHGENVKGIIDLFAYQMRSTFGQVNLWIEDNVLKPMKDKFDMGSFKDIKNKIVTSLGLEDIGTKIKSYLFGDKDSNGDRQGGLFSDITNGVKNSFKNAGSVVKEAFKTVFNPLKGKFKSKKTQHFEELDNEDYTPNTSSQTAQSIYDAKQEDMNKNSAFINMNQYGNIKDIRKTKSKYRDINIKYFDEDHKGLNENTLKHAQSYLDKLEAQLTDPKADVNSPKYKKLEAKYNLLTQNHNRNKSAWNQHKKDLLGQSREQSYSKRKLQQDAERALNDKRKVAYTVKRKGKGVSTILGRVDQNDAENYTTYGDETPSILHNQTPIDKLLNPINKMEGYLKEIVNGIKSLGGKRTKSGIITGSRALTPESGFDIGESNAANSFSQGLAQVISKYIHGNASFMAQGSNEVKQSTVAVIGKGEAVIPAKDLETLKKIVLGTEKGVGYGKKNSKLANTSYNSAKALFANIPPEQQSLYMSTLAELMEHGGSTLTDAQKKHYQNINKSVHDKLYTKDQDKTEKSQAGTLVSDSMKELGHGISETSQALTGKSTKEQRAKFGVVIDDVSKHISDYAPDAMGSAMIGGGVSLITGAIGGPLLGAAVGAGISIAKRSTAVQEMLFGEKDENGDRKGGMVSKGFLGKMKKYLPDLKNYGIVGGITGLMPFLPFGPITGIMLGGAFSYAKNNEDIQKRLFGEEGLFKSESKDKLKKMLPRLGAGAAAMMIAGPFGLLGNAVLGSGLGFLSTTDKFKEIVLGKKDKKGVYQGGILPSMRKIIIEPLKAQMKTLKDRVFGFVDKNMLTPLKNAFEPLAKQVEVAVNSMFKGVGGFLKKMFMSSIGLPMSKWVEDKLLKPGAKLVGGLFKGLMMPVKAVISAPFKAIGVLGTAARRRQLKKGNATYMTAEERASYRLDHNTFNATGGDKYASTDAMLASLSAGGELDTLKGLQSHLKNITSTHKDLEKKQRDIMSDMGNDVIKKLSYNESAKIMTALKNKGPKTAEALIVKSKKLTPEDQRRLIEKARNYSNFSGTKESKDKLLDKALKELHKKGFKDITKDDLSKDKEGVAKLAKYVDIEVSNLEKKKKTQTPEDLQKEQLVSEGKYHIQVVDKFDQLLNFLKGNDEKVKKVGKDAREKLKNQKELDNKNYFTDKDGKRYKVNKDGSHKLDKSDPINKSILRHEASQKKADEKRAKREERDKKLQEKGKRDSKGMLYTRNSQGELIPDLSDSITNNAVHKAKDDDNYKRTFMDKLKTKLTGAGTEDKDGKKEKKGIFGKILSMGTLLTGTLSSILKGGIFGGIGKLGGGALGILGSAGKLLSKFGPLGIIGGVIGTGVALANAPKLIDFFKTTVAPWVIKNALPLLQKGVNSAIQALPSIISFAITDVIPLIGKTFWAVGKGIVNGIGEILQDGFNYVKAFVAHPFDETARNKAIQEGNANIKAKYANNNSELIGFNNPVSANDTKPNNNTTYTDANGVIHRLGSNNTSTNTSSPISSTENVRDRGWISNGVTATARTVLTGRAGSFSKVGYNIGNSLYKAGDIVTNISKKTGIAKNAIGLITHPFKSVKSIMDNGLKATLTNTKGSLLGKGLQYAGIGISKIGNGATNLFNKVGKKILPKVQQAESLVKDSVLSKTGLLGKGVELASDIAKPILENITKFMNDLFSSSVISALVGGDKCKILIEKFVPNVIKSIGSKIAQNMAKLNSKIIAAASSGGLLNLAWAVGDFVSGYRNAKSILGIEADPSFGMKIASGLLKAFNGLFIVLSFIPENVWVDLFVDGILPIFGQNDTEIQKLRKQTRDDLAKYNKENGQDLSVEDYTKNINKIKLDTKVGNTGKTLRQLGDAISQKASSGNQLTDDEQSTYKDYVSKLGFFDNVKRNISGLGTQISTTASKVGNWWNGLWGGKGGPNEDNSDDKYIKQQLKSQRIYKGIGGGNIKGIPMGTSDISSNYKNYDSIFKTVGSKYGVDPDYLEAISMQESGGNVNSNNGAALGLMQIENGGTTDDFIKFGQTSVGETWTPADRSDPSKAIPFAAHRISEDLKRYNNDYLKTTQAYNFSHYSLDALLKAFPTGDDWLAHRKDIGQYNGTGLANYGDPNYIEHVLRYYHGNAISSDGSGTGAVSSDGSSSTTDTKPKLSDFFSGLGEALSGSFNTLYGFKDDTSSNGTSSDSSNTAGGDATGKAAAVIATAKAQLGKQYVFGATGPDTFDCSGLMQYSYKQNGIDIGRSTYDQVKDGTEVADKKDLKPADLVLFGSKTSPHHVGMYLGNDEYIQAPHTGDVVKISKLSQNSEYATGRRIINEGGPKSGLMLLNNKNNIGGPADSYFSKKLHGNLTSPFGFRKGGGKVSSRHTGIDIGAAQGTSIPTPVSGVVSKKVGTGGSNGYGNLLVVKDKNNAEHYFGHMKGESNLSVGSKVKAGQTVGKVGSTGNSTGPHLHYETKTNGVSVEPNTYLKKYAGSGGPNQDEENYKNLKKMNENKTRPSEYKGKGGGDTSSSLLTSIVNLLSKISSDTSNLSSILTIISKIVDLKSGNSSTTDNSKSSGTADAKTRKTMIDQVKNIGLNQNTDQDSLQQMIMLLNSIAQI